MGIAIGIVAMVIVSVIGSRLVSWLESDKSEYDYTIRDDEYAN